MPTLLTQRTQLVPFTREHYDAIVRNDNERLGQLLQVQTPDGWTEYADAIDALPVLIQFFEQLQGDDRWGSYFIIHAAERKLIGTGGYKGMPDEHGMVEIGYEIRSAYRSQGYATEAAMAWIAFARTQPGIVGVRAHTLAAENHSVGVLRKCGMQYTGQIHDPQDGDLWQWEIRF